MKTMVYQIQYMVKIRFLFTDKSFNLKYLHNKDKFNFKNINNKKKVIIEFAVFILYFLYTGL